MPKQKPKRIRTRPGKTPAIQINWTEEEVSNIKFFSNFVLFGFRSRKSDVCGIFIAKPRLMTALLVLDKIWLISSLVLLQTHLNIE